jgi:protein SCO1/2
MEARHVNRGQWILILLLVVLYSAQGQAQQRYPASGLVLSVDRSRQTMLVSCQEIRGFMDAMVMSFTVPDAKSLDPLTRGALIEFALVVNKDSSHAENVRVRGYDSAEPEPSKARRLKGLEEALRGPVPRLAVGQAVPDFTLTDQQKRAIHFRQFAGKVVALNFVYTRCARDNFGNAWERTWYCSPSPSTRSMINPRPCVITQEHGRPTLKTGVSSPVLLQMFSAYATCSA